MADRSVFLARLRERTGSARARTGSVRVRTTSAAVIVVGAALVLAAVLMVSFLRRSLTADVHAGALLRAHSVADILRSGDIGDMPQAGRIPVASQEEEFAQVLAADGHVVASSWNLAGRGPVARLPAGETALIAHLPLPDPPFLAVAISATAQGSPVTVIVGRTLDPVSESSQVATRLLAAGIPLVLLVAGVVTWLAVGRALAPVDAIRSEVEAISTRELHRRVPDPAGKDEIARLAKTMNRMLGRLEEGQARQRRFVSDASHELRSPVASIREHAEIALAHPGRTRIDELAEVVLEEDARLQRVIDDLLLLTRSDERTLTTRSDPVDLDDLVFEEAARLRSSTGLRIGSSAVSAGRVIGDRSHLDRLVRNLTANAARHARGAIALSLQERERLVELMVDDDGPGIPAGDRTRVFDRFVRLEEARDRESGGAGLGLAIVREIAAAHGAAVRVCDSPLGGARFEVRFPRPPADPS